MKNFILLLFLFAAAGTSATPAPDFTITTSDNQTLQLYQNFINQGKVVVIEAFFTTCPPCNTHAPLLQNLYTQMLAAYPGKVEFILLSTLSSDTNVKVAQYKTSKGLTMPAAGANGGSLTALQPYTSGQFGPFQGTPTFIVIAPNTGTVHYDIRGNSASGTMTLLSQKIAELLPAPPPPPTFCSLKDYFDGGLEEVDLRVTAPAFDTVFTADGSYSLSGVLSLKNKTYSINPDKNDNPLNGITTYDLVLISKHILGIQALLCDWQLIAADVNCSGSVTTFDIVSARKLILGIDNALPCGSWRFIPDSATASNGDCAPFLGVKIGDVNAGPCAQFEAAPEDRAPLSLEMNDRVLLPGERATVEVLAGATMDIQGIQATLAFRPDQLSILKIDAPQLARFDRDAYNPDRQQEGMVPLAWINPSGQRIGQETTVLTLELMAHQGGKLSEMLGLQPDGNRKPEVYDATGGIHPLELTWRNQATDSPMYTIAPNPVSGPFTVSTVANSDQHYLVQLFDFQGKMVFEKSYSGYRGLNRWAIDPEATPSGLYCLRVNGALAGKVLLK